MGSVGSSVWGVGGRGLPAHLNTLPLCCGHTATVNHTLRNSPPAASSMSTSHTTSVHCTNVIFAQSSAMFSAESLELGAGVQAGEAAEFNLWHRISSRARAALPTFIPHICPLHTLHSYHTSAYTTFKLPALPHIYHIEAGRMLHSYIMVTRLPFNIQRLCSHISHEIVNTMQSHFYTFSYIPLGIRYFTSNVHGWSRFNIVSTDHLLTLSKQYKAIFPI